MSGNKKTIKNKNKSRVVGKVFAVIFAVLLVGALATSMTFNYLQYEKAQAATNTPTVPDNPEDPSYVVTPVNTKHMEIAPMALAMTEAEDEHIVRLTATVLPANATNKKVDWTIAFANPNSTWANGKNVADYVTLTPTASGARTADVQCVKSFSEQVIVTVTSQDNADAYATCTVDCVVRYSFNGVKGSLDTNQDTIQIGFNSNIGTIDDAQIQTAITVDPTYLNAVLDQMSTNSSSSNSSDKNNLVGLIQRNFVAPIGGFTNHMILSGTYTNPTKISDSATVNGLMSVVTLPNNNLPLGGGESFRLYSRTNAQSKIIFERFMGLTQFCNGYANAPEWLIYDLNLNFRNAMSVWKKSNPGATSPVNFTYRIVSEYYDETVTIPITLPDEMLRADVTNVNVSQGSIVF